MSTRGALILLLASALAATGCGSKSSAGAGTESTSPTPSARHFATPGAIAAALKSKGFELHGCDDQAEPTVISERAIQCFHTAPDGASDAVAFDIYSSQQQEDEARDYLAGLGAWAETLYGDGWSVSSKSRQTARQVRAILGADAEH